MVILGQGPYHDDGSATGRAFPCRAGGRCRRARADAPFKALGRDVVVSKPTHAAARSFNVGHAGRADAQRHRSPKPRAPGARLEKVGRRSRTPLSARWPRTAPARVPTVGQKRAGKGTSSRDPRGTSAEVRAPQRLIRAQALAPTGASPSRRRTRSSPGHGGAPIASASAAAPGRRVPPAANVRKRAGTTLFRRAVSSL